MNVAEIIESMGAFLRNDHFVYSSGKHGEVYINKNDLVPNASTVSDICLQFAENFKEHEIDVVVGPAVGGIILAQWTAFHLSNLTNRKIPAVFAEKGADKTFFFGRGYDEYVRNKNVLIVDDLLNSSSTAKSMIKAIRELQGNPIALTVMINRNPREVSTTKIDGVDFHPLCEVDVVAYNAEQCPFCQSERPINTKVGHGKKFLENR